MHCNPVDWFQVIIFKLNLKKQFNLQYFDGPRKKISTKLIILKHVRIASGWSSDINFNLNLSETYNIIKSIIFKDNSL